MYSRNHGGCFSVRVCPASAGQASTNLKTLYVWMFNPIVRQGREYWTVLQKPRLCSMIGLWTCWVSTVISVHGNYSMIKILAVVTANKLWFSNPVSQKVTCFPSHVLQENIIANWLLFPGNICLVWASWLFASANQLSCSLHQCHVNVRKTLKELNKKY